MKLAAALYLVIASISCILWARGITASASFDENGRSVQPLDDGTAKFVKEKEPAVEWCQPVNNCHKETFLITRPRPDKIPGCAVYHGTENKEELICTQGEDKEICGMSDGLVIWRRK